MSSRGLWAIRYSIAQQARAPYLDWFHGVHMPEKRARPGYGWASHYESVQEPGSFLALFAGDDAGVFLAPSPAELKRSQDALTRSMVAHRVSPAVWILAEVFAAPRTLDAGLISFTPFDAATPAEQDERCAALAAQRGQRKLALYSSVIGPTRFAVLEPAADAGASFQGRRISPGSRA